MATRPRHHPDAPALFSDLEPDTPDVSNQSPSETDPVDVEVDTEGSGLDRLVTKVSSRPSGWAMKWRPDESSSLVDSDADRHPARPAATAAVDMVGNDRVDTDESDGSEVEATSLTGEPDPAVTVEPAAEPEETTDFGEMSTETWGTSDITAEVDTVAEVMPEPAVAAAPSLIDRAGWPIAVVLALSWLGTALYGDRAVPASVPGVAPVQARPAGDPEGTLLRAELATMRDEHARLRQEVDAAAVLMEDHQRLSQELTAALALNQRTRGEAEALREDLGRWQRRYRVAMERLDEMDGELQLADDLVATLEADIETLTRRIDLLDASAGTD